MTETSTCATCPEPVEGDERIHAACLGRVRRDLAEIARLTALLPDELEDHAGAAMPLGTPRGGGDDGPPDVLVLAAGGTASNVNPAPPTPKYPEGNRDHAADQWPSDPPSVVGTLTTWEDDWRRQGWEAAPGPPTLTGAVAFLNTHLTWAARHHPAFADFARDLRALAAALRRAVRDDERPERGVSCPYCGERLVRRYDPPNPCRHPARWIGAWAVDDRGRRLVGRVRRQPHCDHSHDDPRRWPCRGSNTCGCDQGGRRDDWVCSNRDCGTTFDPEQHTLAVWAEWARTTDEKGSEAR